MKTLFIFSTFCILFQWSSFAQQAVGIGTTTPNSSAMLDITSPLNNKGLLIPRLTSAQRIAITSPATGLIVYQTDGTAGLYMNNGTSASPIWAYVFTSGSGALSGSGAATQVAFWNGASSLSSNSNLYWDNTNSRLGIGTPTPAVSLDVTGNGFRVANFINTSATALNFYGVYGSSEVTPNYGFGVRGDGGSVGVYGSADLAGSGPRYGLRGYGRNGSNSNYGVWGSATGGTDAIGIYGIASGGGNNWAGLFDGNMKLENGDMTLNSATGIVNFKAAEVEKGFVQLSGDDLKVGTFSTNTNGKFIIRTSGADQVYVTGNGMGLEVPTPLAKLHVQGGQDADLSTSTNGYVMLGSAVSSGTNLLLDNNEIMVRSGYSAAGTLSLQNDGGELAVGARTTINKANEALKLNGVNASISFIQPGLQPNSFIAQTSTGLFLGANFGNIHLDGTQVAIGGVVPAASGYKLTVTGKIIAEELKVKLSGSWPDYVFENKYKLQSLPELEQFIQSNKHLPNIPSASEIEKNGMEVGDMQKKMMEKIEELTLYVIDLQKQIEVLKTKK